ncbi:MAG: N-6 DNA methylase [Burkholderiales bacterium]|nr:N-6 DNA methylase [Burkholderiales bacterium]
MRHINFNRKIGQRSLDDNVLSDFIRNFEKIPLCDENFEFSDLLGAAYEYLIKFFADSAGRKAGEFYTPADVVRMLVEKNRGSVPSDEALLQLFYLALRNLGKKSTMPIRDWNAALTRFTNRFEDRMPQR